MYPLPLFSFVVAADLLSIAFPAPTIILGAFYTCSLCNLFIWEDLLDKYAEEMVLPLLHYRFTARGIQHGSSVACCEKDQQIRALEQQLLNRDEEEQDILKPVDEEQELEKISGVRQNVAVVQELLQQPVGGYDVGRRSSIFPFWKMVFMFLVLDWFVRYIVTG